MGDNIWLNDRDASRTPMQWTPDRNAGFSTADPGKLFLPVVQSLVYHYSLVNVESQLAQSRSLLHWVRNVIHTRKAHPGLRPRRPHGDGDRPRVATLAFLRNYSGLDRSSTGDPRRSGPVRVLVPAQPRLRSRSRLRTWPNCTLTDLFGGSRFPSFDAEGKVTITLGTQSFYWLRVAQPIAAGGAGDHHGDPDHHRGRPADLRRSLSGLRDVVVPLGLGAGTAFCLGGGLGSPAACRASGVGGPT